VERAADAVHHVGAGQPRRLVDDEPAVERTAARLAAGHAGRNLKEGRALWRLAARDVNRNAAILSRREPHPTRPVRRNLACAAPAAAHPPPAPFPDRRWWGNS